MPKIITLNYAKKTILVALISLTLLSSRPANAIFGIGDIVFDPSVYANAILQYGAETGIFTQSTITAIETTLSTTKSTILDPIGNTLINLALKTATNQIINWAKGGFQGQPLIISNPGKFITNKGLSSIKVNINGLPINSQFGNSIFNTIVGNYKNINISSKLTSLSRSSIPSTTQNSFCSDSNLSQIARDDVTGNDGTYTMADYTARKKDLYDALCVGDPVTDPALAAKLTEVSKQRPSMDTFLAISQGDNEYSKVEQAAILVEEERAKAEDLATKDIYQGAGPVSETTCATRAQVDENGDPYTNPDEAPCTSENTLTPSKLVEQSIAKATNGGIDRLAQIQGSDVLGSLLGFATNFLTSKIGAAFSSATGGAPTPSVSIGGTRSGVSVPTSQTASFVNDLLNNPAEKRSITSPIENAVNTTLSQINSLKITDGDYLAAVRAYKTQLIGVKSCYDGLIASDSTVAGDARVIGALSFYNSKETTTISLENTLVAELNSIPAIEARAAQTLSGLASSNSTAEILSLFNSFQDTNDSSGNLAMTQGARRQSDLMQYNFNNSQDKTIENLMTQCSSIQTEIVNRNQASTGGGE